MEAEEEEIARLMDEEEASISEEFMLKAEEGGLACLKAEEECASC